MTTAIVLFTRDLRIHDNPALATATRSAGQVVPLFVVDPSVAAGANRRRFLAESLADLRESMRARGGELVIRHGDPATEAIRLARSVGARSVTVAGDVSAYAVRRERRLSEACAEQRLSLTVLPGTTVVASGSLKPSGGGAAYQVFTPFWRVWRAARWREVAPAPRRILLPEGIEPGRLPEPGSAGGAGSPSAHAATGGESTGRRRVATWLRSLDGYLDGHDLLAQDRTSRLSPYLRFGCVSPLELATAALRTPTQAAEAFVRQLCWRDFYYQVAGAFPAITTRTIRAVAEDWRVDDDALAAWQQGQTGLPIVDAGMRQLRAEGWMHNRARLLTGAFLTKHLRLDWRAGARWFATWLLDGDVPNNYGNWQWVAGTGNDTRPNRTVNPIRQARRFDPDGDYVRRYVPELA
ncbi:MAG TPA: deoxyribodipyrimidine photo-lyase, partial [Micromonosporaceae bacterium]